VAVAIFELDVDTIGSRFGGIPQALPAFVLPDLSLETLRKLLAPTITIATLAAHASPVIQTRRGRAGAPERSGTTGRPAGAADGWSRTSIRANASSRRPRDSSSRC
jgi:hypothetical protein